MSTFSKFAGILLCENDNMETILKEISAQLRTDSAWKKLGSKAVINSLDEKFSEKVMTFPLQEILRLYTHFEIKLSVHNIGYLILNTNLQVSDFGDSIENCLIAIKLFCRQHSICSQLESNHRNEFIMDIICNRIQHEEELQNRARAFNWSFNNGGNCLIFEAVEKQINTEVIRFIEERVRVFSPKSIFAETQEMLVFIIVLDEQVISNVARLQKETLNKYGVHVLIAAGGYCENMIDIHKSYNEARRALKSACNIQNPGVIIWEKLGSIKLIASLSETEYAKSFCDEILNKLTTHDLQYKSELIKTIASLEKNNWNLRAAAQNIFVHYNTIKYRVNQISELTGFDMENSEHRFNVSLALRIMMFL